MESKIMKKQTKRLANGSRQAQAPIKKMKKYSKLFFFDLKKKLKLFLK